MKCYVIFFSEYNGASPLVQKVFLSKKEANDYVEFKNWECKDRYKRWCIEHSNEYFEDDVHEVMWVETKELF
jgi:hypothetical protein